MRADGIKWDETKYRKWQARMDKLARSYPTATTQAAAEVAKQVLNDAIFGNVAGTHSTPTLTGNLRSSATYEVFPLAGGGVRIVVGFNTPYAAAMHEAPEDLNWTEPGSGPKFLEGPLLRNRAEYIRVWGEKVHRKLGMT